MGVDHLHGGLAGWLGERYRCGPWICPLGSGNYQGFSACRHDAAHVGDSQFGFFDESFFGAQHGRQCEVKDFFASIDLAGGFGATACGVKGDAGADDGPSEDFGQGGGNDSAVVVYGFLAANDEVVGSGKGDGG